MNLWTSINSLRLYHCHLSTPPSFDENVIILNDFQTMQRVLDNVSPYILAGKVLDKEKNNNVKRIQRVFRHKISAFYTFVSSLLTTKLKKSVKESKAAPASNPQIAASTSKK